MKSALTLVLLATVAFAEEVSVKTDKGSIKGIRQDHDFGQYYYSFRGIRYAQTPTGKLRFKVLVILLYILLNALLCTIFTIQRTL